MSIVSAGVASAASSHCVGAAARDPKRPCSNPTLSVFPAPAPMDGEPRERGTPCWPRKKQDPDLPICTFGTPATRAKDHFAIVGDSHVTHWRATLDILAKVKRWHGTSLMRHSCAFSDAVKRSPHDRCTAWYASALAWFRDHPEVSTVFVTQLTSTPVVAKPGRSYRSIKISGFQRTWRRWLPKTVKHVIVIRDNPRSTPAAIDCLPEVIAAGTQRPGVACAVPRSVALPEDLAVVAARRLRSTRYQHIDLTQFFCSRTRCFPVIGGVLVNLDGYGGHITQTYARSLAPYMLRKLRRLMASW